MINSSHGNLSFLHFFISLISAIPIFISAPHFLITDFSVAHFRSCCFCVFIHHFCSLPFVSEAMCVHKCWPSFLVCITCFFLVSLPSGRGEAWLQLLPPIRPPAEQLRLPLAPFGSLRLVSADSGYVVVQISTKSFSFMLFWWSQATSSAASLPPSSCFALFRFHFLLSWLSK